MKLTVLLFLLVANTICTAQACKNNLFLQDGKTIEMTLYNKKGEPNGKQVYTVSGYTQQAGTATASIQSELFDKKGKSLTRAINRIQCTNGKMLLDMKLNLAGTGTQGGQVDATAQSYYLEYPSALSVGDVLADGHMQVDLDMKGTKQSVTVDVTNRKVTGKESLTTPAGTWDCYTITSHYKTVAKVMGISIPTNMDATEWFAPGSGIIKTSTKAGESVITAIR